MVVNAFMKPDFLSAGERSAIAEIEGTTNVLKLITLITHLRFACIVKFTESDWLICSVHDPDHIGMAAGEKLPIEITICSDFRTNPQALLIPNISENPKYASRPAVRQYGFESYAGVPIYLPDGTLYGALCAVDSRATLFENPDIEETLTLFARLIGCIFFANGD